LKCSNSENASWVIAQLKSERLEQQTEFGIELQRNADGSVNASETMLKAIDAIKAIEDPTERAKRSQELFGRSYTEVAELIEMGAGNVRTALDNVSDAKVIDESELEKARKLRESMDNLKDSVEDLALMFGEELAPRVAEAADNIVWLKENASDLIGDDALGGIAGAIEQSINPIGIFNDALREGRDLLDGGRTDIDNVTDSLKAQAEAAYEAAKATEVQGAATSSAAEIIASEIELARTNVERFGDDGVENMGAVEESADDAADAVDDVKESFQDLRDEIKGRQDFRSLRDQFDEVKAAAVDAFGAAASGADDAGAKADELAVSTDDLRLEVLDYMETLGEIPAEVSSDIMALIDQGAYDQAWAMLAELERERIVNVRVTTGQINPKLGAKDVKALRSGTMYHPGGAASFNEPGNPEMAIFPDGRVFMPDMPAGSQVHRLGSGKMTAAGGVMGGGGSSMVVVDQRATHHHYHQHTVTVQAARSYR
jgi:hypothetical protein